MESETMDWMEDGSDDVETVRYHREAIPIESVGEKFQDCDENRKLLEEYFDQRKKVFGDECKANPVQPKYQKFNKCRIVGCDMKPQKGLCRDHFKIGSSIMLFCEGRLCPVDNCLNKFNKGGKCAYHRLSKQAGCVNRISMEQVEEVAKEASKLVANLVEEYPHDMFYVGISQDAEHRGKQHNNAKGKTSGFTEQYLLVTSVEDFEVLGALEHKILDMSAQKTDPRRFKNDMPGGGYCPKNERSGDAYLLRFAGQYNEIQAASKRKDFSGGPWSFTKSKLLEYPNLTLPKIKEPLSVHKALKMIGYIFDEKPEKLRDALYKCDYCPSSFHMRHHLVSLIKVHIDEFEKCKHCKYKTRYHGNMRFHMRNTHGIKMKKKVIEI